MITIRLAQEKDFDFFYRLKCEEQNIFWTGHDKAADYENLKTFFQNILLRQREPGVRKLYIITENETPVGYLYIIPSEVPGEYDLPVAISQAYGGRGFAKQAVMLGLEEGLRLGYTKMVGSIREDNIASMRVYQSCGVKITDKYRMVYIPMLQKEVKMFIVEKDL